MTANSTWWERKRQGASRSARGSTGLWWLVVLAVAGCGRAGLEIDDEAENSGGSAGDAGTAGGAGVGAADAALGSGGGAGAAAGGMAGDAGSAGLGGAGGSPCGDHEVVVPGTGTYTSGPGRIAVDDAYIYWDALGFTQPATLRRVKKSGGVVEDLVAECPGLCAMALISVDHHLYYSNPQGIERFDKLNGSFEHLWDGFVGWVMATDGAAIFFSQGNGYLDRLDSASASIEQLAQKTPLAIGLSASSVYFSSWHSPSSSSHLYAVPKGGGTLRDFGKVPGLPPRGSSIGTTPQVIVAGANNVYWLQNALTGGAIIAQLDKNTGSVSVLYELPTQTHALLADSRALYWMRPRGYRDDPAGVISAPLDGGPVTELFVQTDDEHPLTGMAQDAHCLYWTTGDGAVHKVAK